MDWDEKTKVLINALIASFSNFDVNDIPKVLPKLITHVEKLKQLDGDDKKNMIVAIF